MLSELRDEKNIPNFLEKGDNLDLYKDEIKLEPKQEQNEVKDSELFINELNLLLKNRNKELTSQYYANFGFDLSKKYQRIYEILFGKNTKYSKVKSNVNEQREDFSDIKKIKIFVATWNTTSTDPSKIFTINLDSLLIPKDSKLIPDIYFVCFQEFVKLNAKNIIVTGEEK